MQIFLKSITANLHYFVHAIPLSKYRTAHIHELSTTLHQNSPVTRISVLDFSPDPGYGLEP
jgi:hypothetical protein